MAMTLADVRAKYPQYADVDDQALADALYKKFYTHADRREFDARVGLKPYQGPVEAMATAVGNLPADIAESKYGIGRGLAEGVQQIVDPTVQPERTPPLKEIVQPGAPIEGLLNAPASPTYKGLSLGAMLPGDIKEPIARAAATAALGQELRGMQAEASKTPLDVRPGSPEEIAATVAASTVEMVGPAALSLLVKNPGPLVAYFGARSGGQGYAQAREAGAGVGKSQLAAGLYAASEVATEALAGKVFVDGGKTLLGTILKTAGVEGLTEGATEALQALVDSGVVGIDMTLEDALNRIKTAAIAGGITGGIVGGITTPFRGAEAEADPAVAPGPAATPDVPQAPAALPPPSGQLALPSPEAYAPPEIVRRQPELPTGPETRTDANGQLQVKFGRDGEWHPGTLNPDGTISSPGADADMRAAEVEQLAKDALKRSRQDETAALLQTARETVSPVGVFEATDLPADVAIKVNTARARRGRSIDLPITVEDMVRAKVPQEQIDAVIATRKPLTAGRQLTPQDVRISARAKNIRLDSNFDELARRATGASKLEGMSQTQLSVLHDVVAGLPAHPAPVSVPVADATPFTDKQYDDAVATVRKQGRYTLAAIKEGSGLKSDNDARALRAAMVRRGQLVQRGANDYRLYDTLGAQAKPVPSELPEAAFVEHVVKQMPVGVVALHRDGKQAGKFASQAEAADAVRKIRVEEAGNKKPASKLEIKAAGNVAYGVLENRYDEQGNFLGQAAVDTYRDEASARTAAEKLNDPARGAKPRPTTEAPAEKLPPGRFVIRKDGKPLLGVNTAAEAREELRRLRAERQRLGLKAPDLAIERAPGVEEAVPLVPRIAETPSTAAPPPGLAGRVAEVAKRLEEIGNTRGLPLLGTKVSLADKVSGRDGAVVEGTFSPSNHLIRLTTAHLKPEMSTDQVVDILAGVMDHETVHALKAAGVLDPAKDGWTTLVRYAAKTKKPREPAGRTYLEAAQASYGGRPGYETRADIEEEAIAEVFRHWAADRRAVTGKPATVLRQLVEWFKRLIRAVPEDLLRSIESGELVRQFKAPGSSTPRARTAQTMAQAQTGMAAAQATGDKPVAQANVRRYVRARDQAREDRYGRAGDKTVNGDTPSLAYAVGETPEPTALDDVLEVFAKASGKPAERLRTYLPEPVPFLEALAGAQEKAQHNPKSDAVAKAYRSLTAETRTMFDALGIKVEVFAGPGEPYASPREMFEDITSNKKVKLRLSTEQFGTSPENAGHPMYAASGVLATDGTTPLTHNDLLRVVHEVYGRMPNGLRYQPRDAYNAYHAHRLLYSKDAVPALLTETLAQSAWQNYGPHMRRSDGTVPQPFDADYLPANQRQYAVQKAYVLPDMVFADPGVQAAAEAAQAEELGEDVRYSVNSPAFQSWFGQSAVSENGLPLRVYHATSRVSFDEFNTNISELGTHFGTVAQANGVAAMKAGEQRVDAAKGKQSDVGVHTYPVYLSIQRPLRLRDEGTFNNASIADQLVDLGMIDGREAEAFRKYGYENRRALQQIIKGQGYDGVVYLNRLEGAPKGATPPAPSDLEGLTDRQYRKRYPFAADSWIIFEPTQAKSAIGNHGTYDPNNPDIRESIGDTPLREPDWQARTSITSPDFDETYGDRLPGGRLYGNNAIDPATAMSQPGTSPVALSAPVDGGQFFGGRLADAQLRMAQDGIDGASMIYLRVEDFLRLSGDDVHPNQEVFSAALDGGMKFNAMPSIWFDGNDGVVRVSAIDGDYAARAIAGRAERLPVLIQRKGQRAFGSLVGFETPHATVAMPNDGLQEFHVDRRGERMSVGSEAFNKWFGDSKVVDEEGQPLVVYHGSNADFTEFRKNVPARWRDKEQLNGFFFTADPQYGYIARSPVVYPVYLRVTNPLFIDRSEKMEGLNAWDDAAAWIEGLKAQGHDGVIWGDPDNLRRPPRGAWGDDRSQIFVFEPTQIKSAIGNRGTWSAADPDIRYSQNSPIGTRVPPQIDPDTYSVLHRENAVWFGIKLGDMMQRAGRSKTDIPLLAPVTRVLLGGASPYELRVANEDQFLSLFEFNERVRKEGGKITDEQNSYAAQQAAGSKATYRIQEHQRDLYDPLLAAIKAADKAKKFTLKEYEEFLYARHAPERNAFLRARGSKQPNPSGMSDAEAAAIIDRFTKAGKIDDMRALDPLLDALRSSITATRVNGGLLAPDAVSTTYQHWVPMQNGEDFDPFDQVSRRSGFTGRGMSVAGRENRPVVGRGSKAGDLLSNMILQDTMAVVRSEHAAFNRKLVETIASNPELARQDIEILTKPPLKTVVGSDGRIRTIVDPNFRSAPGTYVTKIVGREVVLRVHNPWIERALKGDFVHQTGPILQAIGSVTRVLAAMRTTYNPTFVVTNLARDLQAAALNLSPQDIKGLAGRMLAGVPRASKAVGAYMLSEDISTEHGRYYAEMLKNGWTVSHMGLQTLETVVDRVRKDAHTASGWKLTAQQASGAVRNIFGAVEATLSVAENGVRLSAYVEARRAGASIAQAGYLAKNLTVNFNKRGERSSAMNMMYMFYNAGVQGGSVLANMAKSKRGQKLLAGIVATGFALDLLNRLMSADDNDDGIPDYDQFSEYELSHNLIVPNPLAAAGVPNQPRYLKFPMPLGYNAAHNLGRNVANMFSRKNKTWVDSLASIGTGTVDAFNPIASGGNFLNFFAPTFADPFVDLAANSDFAGRDIVPERPSYGGPDTPQSQLYWASTDKSFIDLADFLNKLSGGNEVRKGVLDVSPEVIDYWTAFAAGGVGKFLLDMKYNITEGAPLLISGKFEDIDTTRLPLINVVVGSNVDRAASSQYYDVAKDVMTVEEEVKRFNEQGEPVRARDARAARPVEFAMAGVFSGADKQIAGLRKQIKRIAAERGMPDDAKAKQTKRLRDQIDEIMARTLKTYYRAREAVR